MQKKLCNKKRRYKNISNCFCAAHNFMNLMFLYIHNIQLARKISSDYRMANQWQRIISLYNKNNNYKNNNKCHPRERFPATDTIIKFIVPVRQAFCYIFPLAGEIALEIFLICLPVRNVHKKYECYRYCLFIYDSECSFPDRRTDSINGVVIYTKLFQHKAVGTFSDAVWDGCRPVLVNLESRQFVVSRLISDAKFVLS